VRGIQCQQSTAAWEGLLCEWKSRSHCQALGDGARVQRSEARTIEQGTLCKLDRLNRILKSPNDDLLWFFTVHVHHIQLANALHLTQALALSTRSACVAHDQDMNCIAVSPNDKIVATGQCCA